MGARAVPLAAALAAVAAAGLADPPAAPPNAPASVGPVLVAGEGGYAAFRIPGIVAAGGGAAGRCGPTVLVLVAEGRRFGCDDFDGQHDIVAKRSTDGGRRWGPLQVVADPAKQLNCSLGSLILPRCEFWDPTVLYDSQRCELLIMSACESRCFLELSVLLSPEKLNLKSARRLDASANSSTRGGGIQDLFLFRSSNSGASWSAPRNISAAVGGATKCGSCYHVSTANGHGMQIRKPSPWAGRLIVPAYGVVPTFQGPGGPWGSSVYYSDDFGRSWNKSTDFSPGSAEGEVVQIPGHPRGDLLANLRNINANGSWGCGALANGMCRVTARSTCVPLPIGLSSVSPLSDSARVSAPATAV